MVVKYADNHALLFLLVSLDRLELPTSRLGGERSDPAELQGRTDFFLCVLVAEVGIEPTS